MKKSTKEFLMFLFEMIGVTFPLVLGIYFIPKTTTFEEACIVFYAIIIFEIVWIIPFTQIIVTRVRKRYNCEREERVKMELEMKKMLKVKVK